MTTGVTNTNISKMLKVRRSTATRCIKENQLAYVLEEPEDDDNIINELKDSLYYYKNLRELNARGVIR